MADGAVPLITDLEQLVQFGTRNFYEVLNVSRQCTTAELKKAYLDLSVVHHPQGPYTSFLDGSTVKFKLLAQCHYVLANAERRKRYDAAVQLGKVITFPPVSDADAIAYWRRKNPEIDGMAMTMLQLDTMKEREVGSAEWKRQLIDAYKACRGDMDGIVERVYGDEERLLETLWDLIDKGDLPAYRCFTHESADKKQARKDRRDAEAAEVRADLVREGRNDLVELHDRRISR